MALFTVEKSWGFVQNGTASAALTKGQPVTVGNTGAVSLANGTQDKNVLYYVDRVNYEALLPNQTASQGEAIASGEKVILHPVVAAVVTVPTSLCDSTDTPGVGDVVTVSSAGKYKVAATGENKYAICIAATSDSRTFKPYL